MMKRFGIITVCLLLVFFLSTYFFNAYQGLPVAYTETINIDIAPLVGAEILPANKIKSGTFRVIRDFNKISGGLVAYGFAFDEHGQSVLRIERWKGRGDGIFEYAIEDIPSHSSMSQMFYTPRQVVWTGDNFQVVFEKEEGYAYILRAFTVFSLVMLIFLSSCFFYAIIKYMGSS